MMKKLTAALLAVLLLVAMTGCTKIEEQAGDILTLDQYTDAFDVALQQQEQADDTLTLPVTFRLQNSAELLNFMDAVVQGRATVFVNELKEYNLEGKLVDVTYTVDYKGTTATITRDAVGETAETKEIAGFTMVPAMQLCMDQSGNLDIAAFAQLMHTLEMDYWFNSYPYHMIYGVNVVVAATTDGQYMFFDYYFELL